MKSVIKDPIIVLIENGFNPSRMISGSKSFYRQNNPDNFVVFNANIVIESKGKIWHGDLDITNDYKKLRTAAKQIGEPLYVLYEMDCRFGTENDPVEALMHKALWSTDDKEIKRRDK